MSWFCLILAGLLEVVAVVAMKRYTITRKKIYLPILGLNFMVSLSLLSVAMQGIAMGVAYAVWTGIGAVASVSVGIFAFNESKNAGKIFFSVVVIAAAVGLKLVS